MKNVKKEIITKFDLCFYDPKASMNILIFDLENILHDIQSDAIEETARIMSNLFGGCTKETRDIIISGIKQQVK